MTLYIILCFVALCAGMALSVYAFGTGGKRKRIFQDIYFSAEETDGVGVVSSSAIVDFMRAEKERGKAVLYSTHYMEEAELLCDRILMLAHGRVIAEGTLPEIYAQTETTNLRDAFKKLIPAGKEEMS